MKELAPCLSLSERQKAELARETALAEYGRVELTGGTTEKIVNTFAGSPYIDRDDLVDTLCRVTDLFYLLKNETHDRVSNDDLLSFLRRHFDGDCGGSVEAVCDLAMEKLLWKS